MKLRKMSALIVGSCMVAGMTGCSSGSDVQTSNTSTSTQSTVETQKSSESPSSTTEEQVTLRMAWWGSQTRHDATMKVIELYESQNPNVKIEAEFYDFDGYFTKLNTLVASNTVWDIFQLGGNFPTYIEKIEVLDDYIAQGIIDVSQTTDAFLATTQSEGKQIGISNGVNTYGIAYDPAIFAEAGVAEPTENWTWNDFETACLTINEKLGIYGSSKIDDFIAGCSMGIAQEDYSLNFFATSNDQLGFEDPMMLVDYIEMKKRLVDAGAYPDPGAIAEIKDIEGDYLVTGEAAMTWVASNQMPTLSDAAGREIKLATVPRKTADGPSGAAIQSSQMMCVSTDSKYPTEAAKFINFFETDEEANKILNGERGASIMSNVREILLKDASESKQEMYNFVDLVGSFKTGEINVISPQPKAEIEDQYKLLLEQVIYNKKTAPEAAQSIYDFASNKFN